MAKFSAGAGAVSGIDFTKFDIADLGTGTPTDTTSTHYKLDAGANDFNEFFGTGFKYDGGSHLISGTLTEISSTEGSQLYDISGFSMAVTTANKFITNKDANAFLAAVFAGADTITGSDKGDNLLGFNGNDTIDGAGGNDTLSGGAGNDSLIGGLGDDSMDGGAGNDTYDVNSAADVAAESGVGSAGGTDTVRSTAASFTLGANIEALTLLAGAVDGTGNAIANVITGNDDDNHLAGDAGNDKLVGGKGNDSLSGDANNDTLDGGEGNDSLDGGSGDDSMTGGAGDDAYRVDSLKDKVAETLTNLAGGGTDTVTSSVTFTLGANLDNLTLIDGFAGINGTGNTERNEITGNDGDNKLAGMAGNDTITGGAGKDFLDGGTGDDSLVGGGDDDVYVVDSASDKVSETGNTFGDELRTNQAPALVVGIEHYTFTGTKSVMFQGDGENNRITGTSAADTLNGSDGDDTLNGLGGNDSLAGELGGDQLDGGAGADTMAGGIGNDIYVIDSAMDKVTEVAGDADDTIRSTITVNLAAYANVEHVQLTGTGAINATGSDGVGNKLTGNDGANKLDGGTGDDTMDGGKGADTYFADVGTDQVSETLTAAQGGGIDSVFSQDSFTLGANIENLTLQGAALTGTGNDGANTITGNDQANTLDGKGGIDKLAGGKGNDTYFVDNAKDVVTEVSGPDGGSDTVNSKDSFILGAYVENLVLTGNKDSSGTGNTLKNVISGDDTNNALFGLAENDTLDGGKGNDVLDGGAGIDDLTGGAGNDTYVLDNVNDVFHESTGDSGDTVATTFSLNLADGSKKYENIENATLLGSAALTATGNGGDNILTGNSGANTLNGDDGNDTLDGKAGADNMAGGKGNDLYFVDNAGEKIFDLEGKDELRSTVTFNLANAAAIEIAALLGSAALNLTGNLLDNLLTGNDGANKIDGAGGNDTVNGGLGNDTLDGGGGSDLLKGGKGDDVYIVHGGETIVENDGEGTDTVQSAMTYSIAAFANVENLTLTGTGAIDGTGNSGANTITGNSAKNTLDGGAGDDTMAGGMGNDTYIVSDAGDKVVEAANAGIDTVLSSLATYTLPANVENLTLTGSGDISGAGNTLGNLITGNDGKNTLDGGAGNDTLAGGLGADDLNGGAGNDTYIYASKDAPDTVHTGDTGGKGGDHVSIVGDPFDWDVRRVGDDLLIQVMPVEPDPSADFDPTQAIRIVGQYAGAGIAYFQGDFGKEMNLFYGDNPNLTTVYTPSGLNGKDQGHNAEVVEGTSGNDTVNGGGGQTDFLYGNDGNDRVNSQSASDEFAFLSGGKGNDTLMGAAGSDAFRGDEGDDSIDGGDGFDRVSYRLATAAVTVDLTKQGQAQDVGAGLGNQGSDTLISIEGVTGSKFNDKLTGDGNDNNLFGLAGNDSLSGGGGFDFLAGGAGNDTLAASALEDFAEAGFDDAKDVVIVNLTDGVLAGVAAHTAKDGLGGIDSLINIAGILAGDFNDTIFGSGADEFFEPGAGDDSIDGGAGFDEIDYFSSEDGVTASLVLQGSAQAISASQGKDTFINIEGLDGGAFNDVLIGDKNGNFLQGRAGNDSLEGGDGGDRLRGGAGNDTIDGGAGFDQVDYFAAASGVHVDLSKHGVAQVISKGEGSDTLLNIEDARGSAFNDTLIGDDGFNTLTGLAGNDSLLGGAGFDILIGGAGNDILNGGPAIDADAASYIDATTGGIIANLSSVTQFGVAAHSAADSFGGIDKLVNIGSIIGSDFGDTIVGGTGYEYFEGLGGNDFIDGGGGFNALEYFDSTDGVHVDLQLQNQFISAGQGTDTILNISDIFGSFFNDTLIGNGTDNILVGRDGDDRLVVLNSLFFGIDGGAGTDRLVINGSFVTITQQDVFNKLFGVEEIDLTGTGNNNLTLNALDVLQTSDTGVMRILGNAGDTVSSQGQGWVFQGQQMIDGQVHDVYKATVQGAQVTLEIEADVTHFIS